MTETGSGQFSVWRRLKGRGTAELVEQFTQEMTLLAEGLCEDQARLRRAVDTLSAGADNAARELQAMRRQLEEQEKRISALEARAKHASRRFLRGDWLGRVMLPVLVLCGTVLAVTLLRIFI